MVFDSDIKRLKDEVGIYEYLEKCAINYNAKYGNVGEPYKLEFEPLYHCLTIDMVRRAADEPASWATLFITYGDDNKSYTYELKTYTGGQEITLDSETEYRSFDALMNGFDRWFRRDCRKAMKESARKTLKTIDSLPG